MEKLPDYHLSVLGESGKSMAEGCLIHSELIHYFSPHTFTICL